ncbi:MAG: methyltransferase domain-containing protein [Gammaproteobacteria bacterium]|nr:MAG: methyltransferase domain-containing protein [Gammaproteobacteria bacterium]
MSNQTINLSDDLYQYLLDVSLRETELLRALREETAQLPNANMQIAPEQGQFMALLVQLSGARKVIEVGVYTGYSSLAVAMALPPDGYLLACDVSEEYTSVARRYWEQAGIGHKIDLHLAPAVDTLDKFIQDELDKDFDFAFIDADKENYDAYYERCLSLLRPGGLITVDNVLWNGSVINPEKQDADTRAIRAFNEKLLTDERVDISLVPIGDGLTLARKR